MERIENANKRHGIGELKSGFYKLSEELAKNQKELNQEFVRDKLKEVKELLRKFDWAASIRTIMKNKSLYTVESEYVLRVKEIRYTELRIILLVKEMLERDTYVPFTRLGLESGIIFKKIMKWLSYVTKTNFKYEITKVYEEDGYYPLEYDRHDLVIDVLPNSARS